MKMESTRQCQSQQPPGAPSLTFCVTLVPAEGLHGRGMPWRCRTCSTCFTTASWQNLRCSCRGALGLVSRAGPVTQDGGPIPAPAWALTFSCSMCFLCCRMRRTS